MELLPLRQIQEWDRFTIENEPISSVDLMERASRVYTQWLIDQNILDKNKITVVVSRGNNGGDGLAIARMLRDKGCEVEIYLLAIQAKASEDFQINLERLKFKNILIHQLEEGDALPSFADSEVIIDGIFGSGLTRPVTGYWAELIEAINRSPALTFAIDIPSGLYADRDTPENPAVVKADHCLSFEVPKLSFFFPSNQSYLKNWESRSIGLHPDFPGRHSKYQYFQMHDAAKCIVKRQKFDHKGHFGKALIVAGQKGMAGASVLSTQACLRSGVGLLHALIPDCNYQVVQSTVPEAMVITGYGSDHLLEIPDLKPFDAIGLGPGLGQHEDSAQFLEKVLRGVNQAIVLDADALNILAEHTDLFDLLPPHSILTPHPGEFKRLFGESSSDKERIDLLQEKAQKWQVYILLKGAYSAIASPDGRVSFNSTGNPGMATGGSGDVLTGLITGLLAQGYDPEKSVHLGVFLHGLAGDLAAEYLGEQALIASDLVDYLPDAFQYLNQYTISHT
jgi:hydroxyethylthiazole kinase-like uncharacterized protein yjeF